MLLLEVLAYPMSRSEAMLSILIRKTRTAQNHAVYLLSEKTRPRANRAIAKLALDTQPGHDGSILCEGLWDHPHHWLRLAMFRRAAAKHFGSGLVGLYEEETSPPTVSSLRALGLTAEEIVPQSVPAAYSRRAAEMLRNVQSPREVMEMTFPDDYPGHYFYDGVLKANKVGQVDGDDPSLAGHLSKALHYLAFYEGVFDRHDIRAVVVSHPTTIRFSTLVWAALGRGIPVFVMNYENQHITIRKLTKADDFVGAVVDYPSRAVRDALAPVERKRLAEIGGSFLQAQRTGREGQIAMVGVYGDGKLKYGKRSDFCRRFGGDSGKPNIVLMGNCFPDFPNAMGPSYFTDYVEWIKLSLAAIEGDAGCNWILKPHPAEHHYGDRVSLRTLVGETLPDGVFFWPDDMSGLELVAHADCIVTAAGTSAIEYSALGKRVLVGRETPYTPWGFVNFASSRQEYVEALRNAAGLPLPDQCQQEDAKIYTALTLADPPTSEAVRFPWGLKSYRLWPGLPGFIESNRAALSREISFMEKWLRSGATAYNVYKKLNLTSEYGAVDDTGSVVAAS